MFVRNRLARLFDDGEYEEAVRFANCEAGDIPADGVVTAIGQVGGQTVCVWPMILRLKLAPGASGQWGKLFVDSADKAAKYINLCDAFSIPLRFWSMYRDL